MNIKIIGWPITRERYRQVLLKMRRQGVKILWCDYMHEMFTEGLERRIENLTKSIEVLERHERPNKVSLTLTGYRSELATTLAILEFYNESRRKAMDAYVR